MTKTASPIVFKDELFQIGRQVRETMPNWAKYLRNVYEVEIRRAFGLGVALLIEADESPVIRKKRLVDVKTQIAYIQTRLEEAKLDGAISIGFWEQISYALSKLRFRIEDYLVDKYANRSKRK